MVLYCLYLVIKLNDVKKSLLGLEQDGVAWIIANEIDRIQVLYPSHHRIG